MVFDPTFKPPLSKPAIATGERSNGTETRSPASVLDDAPSRTLVGCNGSENSSSRRISDERAELRFGLVVIVDLMNLLVRAYHAGPPSRINGVRSLLQTAANIIERLAPEYLIFAADGGHVERSKLYPKYKDHRPPKPDELVEQIKLANAAIQAIGWPIVRVVGWEADDVIASLASSINRQSAGFVVASSDKDLLQLCDGSLRIKIYHPWDKGAMIGRDYIEEKYLIQREQFLDYQALAGDASDGVPGVDGIGPKKAADLLKQFKTLDGILMAAEQQKIPGVTGKNLRSQTDRARISRQLVTLHRGLTIPNAWQEYPAASPSAGWMDALRKMDLGAAAQRLSDVIPVSGRVRGGTSLIEVPGNVEHSFWKSSMASACSSEEIRDR